MLNFVIHDSLFANDTASLSGIDLDVWVGGQKVHCHSGAQTTGTGQTDQKGVGTGIAQPSLGEGLGRTEGQKGGRHFGCSSLGRLVTNGPLRGETVNIW